MSDYEFKFRAAKLIKDIDEWWNKAQYETTGEYNLFDEPPEFIASKDKLKELLEDGGKPSDDSE